MPNFDQTTLSIIEIIRGVVAGEVGYLIYPEGKKAGDVFHQRHAYIKFLPVAVCIEFLGACYDELPFETEKNSENRFNKAIKELFPKSYLPFAKAGHKYYLFRNLRCSLIHQLRPSKGIMFTTRKEASEDGNTHLVEDNFGHLILVLEDFYDDLQKAALKLISLFERGKLTNKKGESAFIQVLEYK